MSPLLLLAACALATACSRAPEPASTPQADPGTAPGADSETGAEPQAAPPEAALGEAALGEPALGEPALAEAAPGRASRAGAPHGLRARIQVRVGLRPEHVLSGDLDGDGGRDLLMTTRGTSGAHPEGALALWRDLGQGGGEHQLLRAGGWPLAPVLVAGAVDVGSGPDASRGRVALASRAERNLVLLNTADGSSSELWRAGADSGVPRALAVGDLGLDGTIDLALATDRRELVLLGGGRVRTLELEGTFPRCALVLADGSAVVVGFQDTRQLDVIYPDGTRTSLDLGFIPRALLEFDFDRSGDPELLVLGGEQTLRVFGQGAERGAADWLGHPSAFEDLRTGPIPIAAHAADFDGDGRDELAVLSAYGLRYELFGATEAGEGPSSLLAHGYAGQSPRGLTAADWNADGKLDLVVSNEAARAYSVLFGSELGLLDAEHVRVGAAPNAVIALRPGTAPDPKGSVEVAALCAKDERLDILAAGPGGLTLARQVPAGNSPRGLTAVDWNGDGRAQAAWLAKTGTGFAARTERASIEFEPNRGGADLAAVALGAGPALAIANDVDGALVVVGPGGPIGSLWADDQDTAPVAVAAVELDGDPEPELLVALGSPGERRGVAVVDLTPEPVELAFMATAGFPIDVAPFRSRTGETSIAALTLVQPKLPPGSVETFHPEQGSWSAGVSLSAGARPQTIAVGDLDDDGFDELFVAAQNDHAVHVFGQAEAGELRSWGAVGAHLGCLDATLADLDGDGQLELIVANGFSNDLSILRR